MLNLRNVWLQNNLPLKLENGKKHKAEVISKKGEVNQYCHHEANMQNVMSFIIFFLYPI